MREIKEMETTSGLMKNSWVSLFLLVAFVLVGAVPASNAQSTVRFGAIGDYGNNSSNEQAVANLVNSWSPDFVITTGDNSYGSASIDINIGKYYHNYIGNYTGTYGSGSTPNRFFPSLGNHDYSDGGGLTAYTNYFTLPGADIPSSNTSGNERYYDFIQGPVHFFAINSNSIEPDGRISTSTQAQWLQTQLANSTSPWKIVYFHHPPYTSGSVHPNTTEMQWPFQDWGATAVLSGHNHNYERILKNGFPYFITGNGGQSLYGFNSTPEPGSVVRYNASYGAMLIEASSDRITFDSYSIAGGGSGTLVDTYTLPEPPVPVQLSSFTGMIVNQSEAQLEWITLTETNNYGFEVQRSTRDGDGYQSLPNGFLPGQGTSLVPHSYSYTDVTPISGTLYYRLRQIDLDGTVHYSDGIRLDKLTGVEDLAPLEFALLQNYPNPFNPTTAIRFSVPPSKGRDGQAPGASHVWLAVYDILGREVATLVNEELGAGSYEKTFDARGLASGLYFYRLSVVPTARRDLVHDDGQAGELVQTKKLVLMK